MLSLLHDPSSPAYETTPLNAAEEAYEWDHRDDPPQPPPKKRFSLHVQPAHPAETAFRHSFWKEKRAAVRTSLASAGTQPHALDRFDQCGGECIVEYSKEAGKHRLRANYCHSRHCEPCMKAKANKLASNLRARLEAEADGRYRFITLTLQHTNETLTRQIKKLYRGFKNMRSMKEWKNSQRGGAAILECKWNPKTREWHPHLHVVSEGDYLDKHTLSRMWKQATDGSYIVDIRKLDKAKDAAFYVAKYVSKGTNIQVWSDPDAAQEWICSLKGVRTCLTFGTWRGYNLLANKETYTDWKPVYSLMQLFREASAGETAAVLVLCKLDGWKLDDERDHHKRPPPAS
jgi:hypothetical protein